MVLKLCAEHVVPEQAGTAFTAFSTRSRCWVFGRVIAAAILQAACSADDFRQQLSGQLEKTCAAWSTWAVALRWINLAAAICEGTKPSTLLWHAD